MAEKTHYEVLRVASDASDDEVRKAFHAIAKTHHPDAVNLEGLSDTDIILMAQYWVEAQASYEAVKTPILRSQYDARLRMMSRPCKPCKGTGTTQKRTGWSVTDITCPTCNGTGKER